MPIHGITGGPGRLPEIGRLHKGGPKQDGGRIGRDLGEQLRFAPADDVVAAAWAAVMGDGPLTSVEVQMPYDEPADNFDAHREMWYSNGSLNRRCTGETGAPCVAAFDQTGKATPRTCTYPNCATDSKGRQLSCKARGRLRVIVPALLEFGILGEVLVLTTSDADCRHIDQTLTAMREGIPGGLRGVRFMLTRQAQPMRGPTGMKDQWLLRLTPVPQVLGQLALPGPSSSRALPAEPEWDDDDEPLGSHALDDPAGPALADQDDDDEPLPAGLPPEADDDAAPAGPPQNGQDVPWEALERDVATAPPAPAARPQAAQPPAQGRPRLAGAPPIERLPLDEAADRWVAELGRLTKDYRKGDGDQLVEVGQTKALAIQLSDMWTEGSPDTNRHLLLAQVFGVDSAKKLTRRQYLALRLALQKPDARRVINAIVHDAAGELAEETSA